MRTLVERLVLILGCTVSFVAAAEGSRGAELFEAQCISCHGNAAVNLKTPVSAWPGTRLHRAVIRGLSTGWPDRPDHV
jgi:mono/diheme cytochrome c family protein